jgi:hypothetical protein
VRPSEEVVAEVPAILETVRLGERIALPGSPDLQALGEALHGLFAADDPSAPRAERLDLARGLLDRWGVPQLDPPPRSPPPSACGRSSPRATRRARRASSGPCTPSRAAR